MKFDKYHSRLLINLNGVVTIITKASEKLVFESLCKNNTIKRDKNEK